MRKFRLREVKQLFRGNRGSKWWTELECLLLGKHHLLFSGYYGGRGAEGDQVHTSDCTVKVRTAVHCCSPQNASTLWVGCDLAFRCWQAKSFLVGGGSCWNRETWPQGWDWKKVAGARNNYRIHLWTLRAEMGRYKRLCRICFKSPFDAFTKEHRIKIFELEKTEEVI